MYVTVFLLNYKISDVLPVINGAQVGYTVKDINAGRNSSRDIAKMAEMKAKANSLINVLFPTSKRTLLPLVCVEIKLPPNSNLPQRNIKY